MFDCSRMDIAVKAAVTALSEGEVPIGAAIFKNGNSIAVEHNRVIALCDPTAHAEVLAIRRACQLLKTNILIDCVMYVTLEPCAMCAKAIMLSKISKIYFGAYNFKTGAIFHGENMIHLHQNILEVIGGVKETECSQVLKHFFLTRR